MSGDRPQKFGVCCVLVELGAYCCLSPFSLPSCWPLCLNARLHLLSMSHLMAIACNILSPATSSLSLAFSSHMSELDCCFFLPALLSRSDEGILLLVFQYACDQNFQFRVALKLFTVNLIGTIKRQGILHGRRHHQMSGHGSSNFLRLSLTTSMLSKSFMPMPVL